jgi:hypothetical protein
VTDPCWPGFFAGGIQGFDRALRSGPKVAIHVAFIIARFAQQTLQFTTKLLVQALEFVVICSSVNA